MHSASTSIRTVLVFERCVLLHDILPQGHILPLDYVHHYSALFHQLEVLRGLLLNERLQLAALLEQLVANRDQEVCIVSEFLFLDYAAVGAASLGSLAGMLLLSLLDLIKDELSASQGVQILHIEQVSHLILLALLLGLLLLVNHLLQVDHVSLIAEKLLKLLEVEC